MDYYYLQSGDTIEDSDEYFDLSLGEWVEVWRSGSLDNVFSSNWEFQVRRIVLTYTDQQEEGLHWYHGLSDVEQEEIHDDYAPNALDDNGNFKPDFLDYLYSIKPEEDE